MKQASIRIDFEGNKIVLTKKFADAASKFGTAEYKQLQSVRRDYSDYNARVLNRNRKF